MDAMLRALADGTRRQILTLVWREERAAGEIAAAFDMTRPAISPFLPTGTPPEATALGAKRCPR